MLPRSRLERALMLGILVALVCIVVFVSLRSPRVTVAYSGIAKRSTPAMRHGNLAAEIKVLNQAAREIEAEFDKLAEYAIFDKAAETTEERKPKKRQHRHATLFTQRTTGTIFVGMASYKDPMCSKTVASVFGEAADHKRVHIGVIEMHGDNTPPCLPESFADCQLKDDCLSDNVRVRKIPPKDGQGNAFGRYSAMLLYHGEEYALMATSALTFAPRWDVRLIAAYQQVASSVEKPVLTQGPVDETQIPHGEGGVDTSHATRVCASVYDQATGIVTIQGRTGKPLDQPALTPWVNPTLLFANASMLREVPLDPHLPYLRSGEEMLLSIRLWTSGFDAFNVPSNIAVQRNSNESELAFAADHSAGLEEGAQRSLERVQYLTEARKPGTSDHVIDDATRDMNVILEADMYGMGEMRSIDEFWEFAHADPKHRRLTKEWCSGV